MTDRIDIQNVLNQMRAMKLQSQNIAELASRDQPDRLKIGVTETTRSFGALMSDAINTVNDLGMEAGRLSKAIEIGDEGVSLTQAMIASQKASIAFQAVTATRNKLVSAYEKIMNMPI